MKKEILIAIGITFLFLGLAIQPSVAVQPDISVNDNDCNLCLKKVSKTHFVLVKTLTRRLETYAKRLSLEYKDKPEVAEKYLELTSEISTLSEVNTYNEICYKLWDVLLCLADILEFTIELENLFPHSFIWLIILYPPRATLALTALVMIFIMSVFNCFYTP